MTDNDLVKKAKQGDKEAIASLIKNSLKKEKIAQYDLNNGCFKIIIEAEETPNQQQSIESVYSTIIKLKTDSITKIIIYGQKVGESFPEWNHEIVIDRTSTKLSKLVIDNDKKENSKNEFIETLQTFEFASIFPYKDVLNPDLYRSNLVRLLLFFGLFPWAISYFASASAASLKDIAWILGIYYAMVWGIVLYNLIKPSQFSRKLTLQCVFFTAFIGIPLLFVVQKVPPFSLLYGAIDSSNLLFNLVGYILGVGFLEEICKGLPIYLFLLNPGKLKEPLTPAFYGAMSGLGFAIAEGVNYSLIYANSFSIGNIGITNHILFTTVRFISLPLIHATWAGIVGYFMGLAAINPSRKNPIIFIGVSISAILHGVYNTFSSNLIGLLVLAFSILLLVTYLRSSKKMILEMKDFERRHKA